MKKISAFISKGSTKFLFSVVIMLIFVVAFVLEQNKFSDYIFIGCLSYYTMVILYSKYMD